MSSSGKKGKKTKGTVLSLQTFLSNGDAPPIGTTQVAKNLRNIDGDDSDDGDNVLTVVCQLPTAPRANRVFDENNVPYKAPFIAYVNNLPFDVHEDDIYAFFNNNNIVSLNLPREDGDTGRVRGFAYIEFETRDDLIHALGLPDPSIKGRRIRIELSNETDQNSRQRGNRRNYDMSSNSENRESTNWRSDNQKREGSSLDYGRADQKSSHGDNSWRSRQRPPMSEGRQYGSRHDDRKGDQNMERPKLNLNPRTLPLPETAVIVPTKNDATSNEKPNVPVKPPGVSAEKIFGSAKPVDTTARDLEIEKRLSEIRQETLQKDLDASIKKVHIQTSTTQPSSESNWRKSQPPSLKPEHDRENLQEKRSGRYENPKEISGDGRQRDVHKGKRDQKPTRPAAKPLSKQQETVLVSSNKYSGLDEESD